MTAWFPFPLDRVRNVPPPAGAAPQSLVNGRPGGSPLTRHFPHLGGLETVIRPPNGLGGPAAQGTSVLKLQPGVQNRFTLEGWLEADRVPQAGPALSSN